jgi:hypothetical protein
MAVPARDVESERPVPSPGAPRYGTRQVPRRDVWRVRPAAIVPRHFSPTDRPAAPVRIVVALALAAVLLGLAVLGWAPPPA